MAADRTKLIGIKDRRETGRHESMVEELHHPYVFPQLNGNRTDVRWVQLTDSANRGIRFAADNFLQFPAHDYTDQDLEVARHDHEIVRRDFIELQLDHQQMGIGGDNSWGAEVHEEYWVRRSLTIICSQWIGLGKRGLWSRCREGEFTVASRGSPGLSLPLHNHECRGRLGLTAIVTFEMLSSFPK